MVQLHIQVSWVSKLSLCSKAKTVGEALKENLPSIFGVDKPYQAISTELLAKIQVC